jgi:serine/threonine-protein kinase
VSTTRDGIARTLHDRYQVGDEVGHGGMATVYRAVDRRTGAAVAIKVLRPEVTSPMSSARFAKEIALTAKLQHPNILPVLDSGEVDGVPFYVMPFVDGETLLDLLRRESQLSIEDAVRLASEIADALGHAHALGIIHRDIKPSNILISHGHAMVSDFGIARMADENTPERITSSGLAVGTVHYMSPEQATTDRLDGRSDLYSLGCLLYEMLGGSPPFAGASAQGVMARHAVDPVPSLRTLRTTVPPSLEVAIGRALAKAPADRYPTMGDFKAAIQQALSDSGAVPARRTSRRGRILAAAGLGLLLIGFQVARVFRPGPKLDANRVMVFPLTVAAASPDSAILGENVATMIGSVLDGIGSLRWIDAWPLLSREERGTQLTAVEAGEIARSRNSLYYVLGRVFEQSGRLTVALNLFAADGDSMVLTRSADAAGGDAIVLARQAVNGLLPRLVPGVPQGVTAGWESRHPQAIASFLLGEAAFRRSNPGPALERYREAIEADSAFSLAAIRGAQAASWAHRADDAASLIATALRQPLPPRYAAFARGYEHYLAGRADSAAAAFRAALALDGELAGAWLQLGEVYRHLVAYSGDADSIAMEAYERAHALDSTSTNAAYHLIEIGIRRGRIDLARPLAERFLAARPETTLAREVELSMRCVTSDPARIDWAQESRIRPLPLLSFALALGSGGARNDCAIPALQALLANDTSSTDPAADGRRWAAMKALQGAQVSQGRSAEAVAAIDRFVERWRYGTTLFLLAAPFDSVHRLRAAELARPDFEGDFEGSDAQFLRYGTTRRWELAVFAAHSGRTRFASAIAQSIRRTGDSVKARSVVLGTRDSLMSESIAIHVALAGGDTASALARARRLIPPAAEGDQVHYDEAWPMAAERLILARLLLRERRFREALDVATVIDSPAASIHPLYLRSSLGIRLEAAEALRDRVLTTRLRERLQRLQPAPPAVSR